MDRWTDGQMDGRTDGQIAPVFYRTSFPFGAEAQKPHTCLRGYHKQTAQQGNGTNDHLLPLGDWLGAMKPLYKIVCLSVHLFIHPQVLNAFLGAPYAVYLALFH